MKIKQKKSKKPKFTALKNSFYAIKTISKCAPGLIIFRILTQTSYWFFTAFIKEILFLKLLLDLITSGGSFKEYVFLILIFVGAELMATGTDCLSDYFIGIKRKSFYKNLNDRIFKKAVETDMSCFENPDFYDKYKRATEIITEEHFDEFAYYLSSFFAGGLTGIFLIIYVITIDPKILLILLVSVLVLLLEAVKGKIQVKKDREMTTHKRSKAYVKRTLYLREFAKDMRTSDIFNVLHERYKIAVEKNREIIKKYGIKIAILETLSGFFGKALPVAVTYIYAAFRFVIRKNLAVSDFSVIMTAMSNLKDVFNDLGEALSCVRRESEYFANLREFMEYETKIKSGNIKAEEFQSLEFKNVSFSYPESDKKSLNNLNLKIEKGQTVAVVGKNGAGKTTFVKLLLRFYDPTDGIILYNGKDIRVYEINSLRQQLSAVFQDYQVFALSVGENVLCREEENIGDKELILNALKKAGIYDKVEKMSYKENTILTREFDEKGVGLSGGEQQKICTARMFAKNFQLAILDEPSSALDPIAEYKMYESLIEETKDKTVIYISHRLSSAVLSDKIYVFENGRVTESGTHEELLASGGSYCNLFTLQASSYNENERSVI
ncbi:MAG: ABC transporter ATP-binding protein [Clostridia bacterium]|nr:ABC transporter ATP-binding protein [Clostridia bacterium]